MKEIESLIASCRERNATFERAMDFTGSLQDFLMLEKGRTLHNRSCEKLRTAEDYLDCCGDYIAKRLGDNEAAETVEVLKLGAVNTADHHGGIYSSQSLQGDMLFGRMLKLLGSRDRCVPIFSFSEVELENTTYARGLLNYGSRHRCLRFPLQPKKDMNRMMACCAGFDAEMAGRLDRFIAEAEEPDTVRKDVMRKVLKEVYRDTALYEMPRYADQCFFIARALSERYFRDGAYPPHYYIEGEEALLPLFEKELKDENSLIWHMFYDGKLRESMNRIRNEEGIPLAGLLLRGADDTGRRVNVQIREDGVIEGMDRRRQLYSYASEPDALIRQLRERKLLPGGYAIAVLTAFERGICWYGGIFQSLYLPHWQALTVEALREAGLDREAGIISAYDCGGYISGPVFALAETPEGGAACAGPFEFIEHPQKTDAFDKWMKLPVPETHIMGLFEIYNDLVPAAERQSDWYEKLCDFCAQEYPGEVMK